MSEEATMEHAISREERTDEYGDEVFGWWCDTCEEGGGTYDPQTTEQEIEEHKEGEHE